MTSTATPTELVKSNGDRSRIVLAACVGAALGGLWGWLYLTANGTEARGRIDPVLDGAVNGLEKVQLVLGASQRVARFF